VANAGHREDASIVGSERPWRRFANDYEVVGDGTDAYWSDDGRIHIHARMRGPGGEFRDTDLDLGPEDQEFEWWSKFLEEPLTFRFQLHRGEQAESFLDGYFQRLFEIQKVSLERQRTGVDRIFRHRGTGEVRSVEYKTDFKAHLTGNAFVELVSNDVSGKQGWAYTCSANYLLYYIPGLGQLFAISPAELQELIPAWQKRYPSVLIRNQGYRTSGLRVPLPEFQSSAFMFTENDRLRRFPSAFTGPRVATPRFWQGDSPEAREKAKLARLEDERESSWMLGL
jgi:hypothetical protein